MRYSWKHAIIHAETLSHGLLKFARYLDPPMQHKTPHPRPGYWAGHWAWLLCAILAGCGAKQDATFLPERSVAQMGAVSATTNINFYGGSRFLEQTSFGPTAASVAAVESLGADAWLDQQVNMPATLFDDEVLKSINPMTDKSAYQWLPDHFFSTTLTTPGQLRWRVAWSLSQFLVVSQAKVQPYGLTRFFNILLKDSFGNYRDLLRDVTLSSTMGFYLDNASNVRAGACPGCAPNENYARELMQLFSLGTYLLNADGTPKLDPKGQRIATYDQQSIANMARALTGWNYAYDPFAPFANWARFDLQMVANDYNHDTNSKTLLGTTIAAGGNPGADLEKVLDILMAHPNIAPFVSVRLIQHLVTSDPSPAYVGRISAIFNNNGKGVKGDLAAVVKAILLDPEARAGDDPGATNTIGKLREPLLWTTAVLRGLGCTSAPIGDNGYSLLYTSQQPLNAQTVFGFYPPDHKAPVSLLLAPEQKLLDTSEFSQRMGLGWNMGNNTAALQKAGCQFDAMVSALNMSPDLYLNEVSRRYFRGSMSPVLRSAGVNLISQFNSNGNSSAMVASSTLIFLLSSPSFGAMH